MINHDQIEHSEVRKSLERLTSEVARLCEKTSWIHESVSEHSNDLAKVSNRLLIVESHLNSMSLIEEKRSQQISSRINLGLGVGTLLAALLSVPYVAKFL